MSILIDIDTKSRHILLATLKEYPIILISKLKCIKYSNVTLISNVTLSKLSAAAAATEGNINLIITNSVKNRSKYEKYINRLKEKEKGNHIIYLFTTIDHTITNPLCTYIPNIKLTNVVRAVHILHNISMVDPTTQPELAPTVVSEDEHKRKFREVCVDLLPSIRSQPIPENISRTPLLKEAVFIEYRNTLPHIETLIRNAVIKLGEEWCFTVVCGLYNYDFIQKIVKSIHPNIRIIETPYTNLSQNQYNNMLLTKSFWNMLHGEKIFIYQEDSFIFKTNIEDFIEWDYIGAPFSKPCVEPINVGNGGLSLRTKSVMLEVIDKHPISSISADIMTKRVRHYVDKNKLDNIPEDVYFSHCIQKYELGTVADFETARQFSMETVYSEDPFGMHCMWHSDNEWEKRMILLKKMSTIHISNSNPNPNNNNQEIPLYDKDCGYLSEEYVKFTRGRGTSSDSFLNNALKIKWSEIDNFICIIDFFNGGGGTTTFINMIVSKYKYYNNFVIIRNIQNRVYVTLNDDYIIQIYNSEDEFIQQFNQYRKITKVFVNHIIGFTHNFLLEFFTIIKSHNVLISTITHDYIHFFNICQPSYEDLINKTAHSKQHDIIEFDEIITQHSANYDIFKLSDTFDSAIVTVIPMPDYYCADKTIEYTNTTDIVVGVIGNINMLKGDRILKQVIETNMNISFVVFGATSLKYDNLISVPYNNIHDLNALLIQYAPTTFLELSIWPETYSYIFTLYAIINIPVVIYTKPLHSVILSRARELNITFYEFTVISEISNLLAYQFESFNTILPKIKYSKMWNQMFVSNYNIEPDTKSSSLFMKYAIYFPQFHTFDANNKLFYNGYTDATNLQLLCQSNYVNETLTPCIISDIHQYDIITNPSLMQHQFELLTDYKFDGIACYYYWFSSNSESLDKMLMRSACDNLLNTADEYNKKMYFIWANENWTSNHAMGNTTNVILTNEYIECNILDNFNNLMPYFTHPAYLKINNKPVIMIYHSFIMTVDEFELVYSLFEEQAILHGFDGIYMYSNSMSEINSHVCPNTFYMNFNYKVANSTFKYMSNTQIVLNYSKYIDFIKETVEPNQIQTLVFDFDNNARLFKPNKQRMSTLCINNYHFLKIKFIKEMLKKYTTTKRTRTRKNDKNETTPIILINALNEWGEKMAIEPSNEIGYYYLNLINKYV